MSTLEFNKYDKGFLSDVQKIDHEKRELQNAAKEEAAGLVLKKYGVQANTQWEVLYREWKELCARPRHVQLLREHAVRKEELERLLNAGYEQQVMISLTKDPLEQAYLVYLSQGSAVQWRDSNYSEAQHRILGDKGTDRHREEEAVFEEQLPATRREELAVLWETISQKRRQIEGTQTLARGEHLEVRARALGIHTGISPSALVEGVLKNAEGHKD